MKLREVAKCLDSRLAVAALTLGLTGLPAVVAGQTSSAGSTSRHTDPSLGFLTGYRFHLNAFGVVSSDEDFVWDTDFGGDLDVFDLRYVRGNVLLNYEGIIGRQLRPIDPNQGNYTIDLSLWWRPWLESTEFGVTLHHVSRHLSDRDKALAIAWNMVGLQHTSLIRSEDWELDLSVRALATIRRSYVDYDGEIGASAQVYRRLHRRVSVMLGGELVMLPVDRNVLGRTRQVGGRVELGARFPGPAGAGEVFVARERRIDADPFDLTPTTFTMLGFRFVGP